MSTIKVYKASAGSGKTFTLAVQYIRLLITTTPQEYMHTLAVTFTNKATTEMKDRILEQLYGIGHNLKSSKGYLEALHKDLIANGKDIDDDKIREKCREALHYILHDYSRFRIETIDSFFQSVLKNLARELNLNARLQIDLNDKQIVSQAVDNMIDKLGLKVTEESQSETTQEEMVSDSACLAAWIDSYVKEQIENADNWDIRTKIKELSRIIFKEVYMNREEEFKDKINNDENLNAYRNKLFAIRNVANAEMEKQANLLQDAMKAFGEGLTKAISRGEWVETYLKKMLGKEYRDANITEKRYAALEDASLLVKKDDRNNTELLSRLEPVCTAMKETEDKRRNYLETINTIDLSLQHINPLRLLDQVEKEVTEITNDTNRFILAKTPHLLHSLIKGSDAPFVFEKMGTIFNNVMIDEFQDTSKLQWENFKVLLFESLSSGGSNLLVGDVKQSIYRFRNGDWHILKNIDKDLYLDDDDIKTLKMNFRSDINIIRFNNAFFKAAAKSLDINDDTLIQEIYDDVQQFWDIKKKEEGYVRVMLKTDKMDDWEERMLDDMCNQIISLHSRNLSYKDMCILVRDRKRVKKLIEYVNTHHPDLKLICDEGFKLSSSMALNTIIAALQVICQGKKDPISERLLMKNYLSIHNGEDVDVEQYARADFKDVLPSTFWDRIDELKVYPLNELCEELYRILELDKIPNEDAYLLCFFDELASYLRNGTSDIMSFLEYWKTDMQKKDIPACQVNGINIVTIHKSKGLQYHTVFMPYCDQQMENILHTEILWCETEEGPYNEMGTLPINGSSDRFRNSLYRKDYEQEELQRRIEELNALYVAFTRAEHNLFVWGSPTKESDSKNTYSNLMQRILDTDFETTLRNCLPDDKDIDKREVYDKTMTQPSATFSCEKEDAIATYTYGTPYVSEEDRQQDETDKTKGKKGKGESLKNADNEDDEKEKNRLKPKFQEQRIEFKSYNRVMDFLQSNEASHYIREQGDEYDESKETTVDGLTFIEQGKLLHEIFSGIEREDQLEKVLHTYLDRGILTNEAQMQRIRKLIERGMNLPQVKEWFSGKYKVINECEIVHISEENGAPEARRPDRVMFADDRIIVVDFKFGRPNPEEYEKQVRLYMGLMQAMYPDMRIEGHLWYVYRNQIDEVKMEEN